MKSAWLRAITGIVAVCLPVCAGANAAPQSFRYEAGRPITLTIGRYVPGKSKSTPISCTGRTQTIRTAPVKGEVNVYGSFPVGEMNPAPYENNQPAGYQTVTLGQTVEGKFIEALRFGMVDDDRASAQGQANYVPGAFDGRLEYYGMYARPRTTYDFKIKVDLANSRATVWVSGRGDDDWFPLAANAPLMNKITAVDSFRVDQLPKATGVENLVIQSRPWREGERVRPYPLAKKNRVVGLKKGFRFQSQRSLWYDASRHVTVARRPNDDSQWWLGFPDLAQVGPTALVCSYVDGQAHGGGGRWWVARSEDLGRTWRDTTTLGIGGAAMRLQKLRDGSLVMSEPGIFRSTDGGRTWTRPGQINAPAAGGHGVDVASRVVEMEDGSWLVAGSYTHGEPWKIVEGETLEFYRSTDQGKTWKLHSTIKPPYPLSLSEPSPVLLPDGRLVVYARESGGYVPGLRACSTDQGRTWSAVEELPFRVEGRTCAALLKDGRVMLTFRSQSRPIGLWAWVGSADEPTRPAVLGVHLNGRHSVGLKAGGLHLDSDGACGQFTRYVFRPPDSEASRVEVTVEVKVVSNAGRSATLSVPFVGKLRLFPDHVQMAHDPSVALSVTPNAFHVYRVVRQGGKMTLSVDGKEALVTEKLDRRIAPMAWSAQKLSAYELAFGNEAADDASAPLEWVPASLGAAPPKNENAAIAPPPAVQKHVTPAVTGYSIWKRFEARLEDPRTGLRTVSWNAASGEFPDQYQLDRMLEIDGTISGRDQGYSGWIQLEDGRVLVLNYTDDTARTNCAEDPGFGVPWIRGTYVLPGDLPGPRR
jgi:hypothetical protein